jgi:hypothetical protein
MPKMYYRYLKGFCQEVYDQLLIVGENVFEDYFYEDALLVMKEIMRRVRHNIELLIPHLHTMGYLFRKGGFWDNFSPEGKWGHPI